ncbi:MAG TPA: helix-hairpin-helix domain-containing protein [Candidatus Marinimicrobia bacterium]|jgi:hypothetical protein|nr:helix-hairpin-helix domain-containing protein [Candidatus Neomarinimicrobiota bacterium]
MKRLGFLLLSVTLAQKVPINMAALEELQTLPLTLNETEALYEYVTLQGPVKSIYDLMQVEGFSAETIQKLRPLISLELEKESQSDFQLDDNYRKIENWTSEEGANEGLVEVWLDRLAEPKNINSATWNDLMALQNVSPVDAVAVLKRIEEGPITYPKALRGAIGLSYWGYTNMADFFTYKITGPENATHIWYNMAYKTMPSTTSFDEEVGTTTPLSNHPGDMHHKLIARFGPHWKISLAAHRQLGEKTPLTDIRGVEIPDGKWSVTYRDLNIFGLHFERIIMGNYSATMGQGIVFENTDFFSPRRSGYSWSRRVHGVFPDISRTREFALRGLAFQGGTKSFDVMGFISNHNRDAILNPSDSSFATLITLYPRTNFGFNGALAMPMLNTIEEVTYGGNVRIILQPGTYVGLSAYESLYDRPLKPNIATTVIADANEGKFLTSIGNTADTEIAAMYSSSGESSLWKKAQSFRRVFGIDFSTVIHNIAVQGEYGILDGDGDKSVSKTDPRALVLTGYVQFNSLNMLVVYRDYDLAFDNPYQRSFSNYQRYKGSIFEDTFYLEDPIYGFLYSGQAQPQSERGFYVYSRYQAHKSLVLTADFDTWTRAADNARYYRTVVRGQFRPVFNVRFHLRHKWQKRGGMNALDPSAFFSQETIMRSQIRLSRYNQVELIWIKSWVDFTNRRRLTLDLDTGGENPSMVGSAGTGSEGLGFKVTHNFSKRLKVMSQVLLYNGFIWNFEDTDFRVFDSQTDALRFWVSIFSRLNDHWAVRLKWTMDTGDPVTNYAFEPSDPTSQYPDQRINWSTITGQNKAMDIRIQVDYAF